ncbi:preprotein translocase subunit SecG [Microbulbifer flavimaris]|uniref:Protein-export membrane protein SecG n=1 Tax=Microbulbifer flavimaris TaxID=1781068 RepID=A0ABX4HY58_9GAMM|nr:MULTISPECIES: preprotein translocase subunit SecG [Microbulbifer]KUJ82684.1 preprotein translocase subunit SecG [Microbulbifer sp. ZGT114]PCO04733.1 preprotein translocase subunit SecG [Microbulbifer flavimaris]
MEKLVLVFHVLTALSIIGLILLQQGKGAEAGASFGAGASQTVFGSQGSGNFFSRLTAIMATVFFVTSLGLAVLAKQGAGADIDDGLPQVPAAVEQPGPAEEIPALEGDVPALEEVPTLEEPAADEIPQAEQAEPEADEGVQQ